MKKTAIVFTLVILSISAFASELKYPVKDIPPELKENVDVVYRHDESIFKIISKNKATYYVHLVITILNEKGNQYAVRSIGYDKLIKVNDFNGYAFDENGKQIKRLRNSEIYDHAAHESAGSFSDNRIKSANLIQSKFPYTVEYEYELEFKYLYSIPGTSFGGARSATQHGSYQLIFPRELSPRVKVRNMEDNPVRTTLPDGNQSVTWTIKNVKPLTFDVFGPDDNEMVPHILATPTKFEFSNYEGNVSTWRDFGSWFLTLNKDRDDLPESTKAEIRNLTKSLTTTEAKVRAVYEYLQNKTRYVSIQFGIGGIQSFPASIVDQTGYGDCKALSTYEIALLNSIGIKGYYNLIEAGEDATPIDTDFPSHQFNHVLVSVPNGKDTLWLECTSQTNPFGYQGSFTEDRWALMVSPDGGKLVKTVSYSPEQNLQSRTAEVALDASGNAKAKVKTTACGIQYENDGLNWVLHSTDKQKKWIEENTGIPNFTINAFSMTEKKDKLPSAIVNLDLTLSRYASVSGKRLFVSPNLMNRISYVPPKLAERKTDIVLRTNALDLDTIRFALPDNLYPEFLPEPVSIKSRFGEYQASFQFDAGQVVYIRKMKIWKGRFGKETYNELVDFYKSVSKADNIKLVFLNKT